jgi:hypothetical protein
MCGSALPVKEAGRGSCGRSIASAAGLIGVAIDEVGNLVFGEFM